MLASVDKFSQRARAPRALDSSTNPFSRPVVLGYPTDRAVVASFSSVRSSTWRPVCVLVCLEARIPFNSSMKEQSGKVVGPNCNICLSR
ncbi:hypothetical protein TIFTF001_017829 [Ficus carica]|uniref:Uncharacterized protein n=1 Tax=Ficus carica TaxID=3494 RepID=A0AA88DA56_FICCA|nr:hypothetical protein TIFTF001_017829 [Ficus carica]